jgi:site-specific DNA recombinase
MKAFYAYIRVSTARQGEEGVSLQEQRRAILEYASSHHLAVAEWHQERASAADKGRPVFSHLVTRLKAKKAAGIIIHKIDRGARNLRDWIDIADLLDAGIEVHFAHERIDLNTRSGRLSGDILAVVAADYSRNLREETLKGFRGRLNQGLYPLQAPLGYFDNGGGKVKTIDPVCGQLVRQAFRYFVAKDCTLAQVAREMSRLGLQTVNGRALSPESMSRILRNPFYAGTIRVRAHGLFKGSHQPLISQHLFDEAQLILEARQRRSHTRRAFLFSRLISCTCGRSLVGELQKGCVYYRCHTNHCEVTCFREDMINETVANELKRTPNNDLLLLAYGQASTAEKRMLISQLGLKIAVRQTVRLAEGRMQLSCNYEVRPGSPELGRILQDILLRQFPNTLN